MIPSAYRCAVVRRSGSEAAARSHCPTTASRNDCDDVPYRLAGYGHYMVFAAAAAVGAGLAVAVDQATHHAKVSAIGAGAAVAIPVAAYLLCLWFLHDRPEYRQTRLLGPIAAAIVLLTPFTGHAVPLTGVVLAALVAVKLMMRRPRLDPAPVAAVRDI